MKSQLRMPPGSEAWMAESEKRARKMRSANWLIAFAPIARMSGNTVLNDSLRFPFLPVNMPRIIPPASASPQ